MATYYFAFVDSYSDSLQMYSFDETNFATVGSSLNLNKVTFAAIAALDYKTVVIGESTGDKLTAYEYNWSTGVWSQKGNAFDYTSLFNPSIGRLEDNLIVVANSTSGDKSLKVFSWDGTDFSQEGNTYTFTSISKPEVDAISSTTIGFIDASNDEFQEYQWDGSDLTKDATSSRTTYNDFAFCALQNSNQFVYLNDTADELERYALTTYGWQSKGVDYDIGSVSDPALCALSDSIVVVADDISDALTAYDHTPPNGTFSQLGNAYSLGTCSDAAMCWMPPNQETVSPPSAAIAVTAVAPSIARRIPVPSSAISVTAHPPKQAYVVPSATISLSAQAPGANKAQITSPPALSLSVSAAAPGLPGGVVVPSVEIAVTANAPTITQTPPPEMTYSQIGFTCLIDEAQFAISQFTIRKTLESNPSIHVEIPDGVAMIDELAEVIDGELAVYRHTYDMAGEIVYSSLIASGDIDDVQIYNRVIVIKASGSMPTAQRRTIALSGVRRRTGGKYQCDYHYLLAPGDTVQIDGNEIVVDRLTYSYYGRDEYIEVVEYG